MKYKPHLERVAQLPCSVCQLEGVQVHHIRGAGLTGAGQKCSDLFTIPLCPDHHRLYHERPAFWEMQNGRQVDHLVKTLYKLMYEKEKHQ